MRAIFAALRFYPYWAIPVGIIFVELGLYFRRRQLNKQWFFFVTAGWIFLTVIVWVAKRGDLHSDTWVKTAIRPDR